MILYAGTASVQPAHHAEREMQQDRRLSMRDLQKVTSSFDLLVVTPEHLKEATMLLRLLDHHCGMGGAAEVSGDDLSHFYNRF